MALSNFSRVGSPKVLKVPAHSSARSRLCRSSSCSDMSALFLSVGRRVVKGKRQINPDARNYLRERQLCPPPAYPLSFPRMTWRGNDFLPHVNVRHRADAVQSIQKPHWPGSKVVGKDGSEFNSYSKLSCSHEDLVQGHAR